MAIDPLPCARFARRQLRDILTPSRDRDDSVAVSVATLVARWSLASLDAATFGNFSNASGDFSVAITAGEKVLTSAENPWQASDVGRVIDVQAAGVAGGTLRTVIDVFTSAGEVVLMDAASASVVPSKTSAAGLAVWGDDWTQTVVESSKQAIRDLPMLRAPSTVRSNGSSEARALAARFAERVNVMDFRCVADGIADDGPCVQAAAAVAQASGKVLYFPAGEYFLETWTAISDASDLLIAGDGRFVSIIKGVAAATFATTADTFSARDVQWNTWGDVVDYTASAGDVSLIEFVRCSFRVIDGYAVNWSSVTGSALLKELNFERCNLDGNGSRDVENGLHVAASIESAWIVSSQFINMGNRPIILGANTYAKQETMECYQLNFNVFKDIDTGAGPANAILAYGRDVTICGNDIQDLIADDALTASTGCEGIYVKARQFNITLNKLRNAGTRQGCIICKGSARDTTSTPQGYGGVIACNQIWSNQANSVGIFCNVSEAEVYGNIIEGMGRTGMYAGPGALSNIHFHHNIIKDTHGVYGMRNDSSGDQVRFTENIIDGVDDAQGIGGDVAGIYYGPVGGTPKNCEVSRNQIVNVSSGTDDAVSLIVAANGGGTIRNVSIIDNVFDVADYGVQFKGTAIALARLFLNQFFDIATGSVDEDITPGTIESANNHGYP